MNMVAARAAIRHASVDFPAAIPAEEIQRLIKKTLRERTITSAQELSAIDAERLRAFERSGHDALAITYHEFFAPVTALAAEPLLDAVRLYTGIYLLDLATGPGALAARAVSRGARAVGVDLSPRSPGSCMRPSNFVRLMQNICHLRIVCLTPLSAVLGLVIFLPRMLLLPNVCAS
jgi:hypothetical protein